MNMDEGLEEAALRALLLLARSRYGEATRLAKVGFSIEQPNGIAYHVEIDLLRWLASQATFRSQAPRARHSADFASVDWFGTHFDFTPLQGRVIRQLWDAWESDTPGLRGETLVTGAGSPNTEMHRVFEGHPAWNSLITSPRKGIYRLAEPEGQ
ncbi:MAG: hypothetical protein KGL39_42910 [Patescibacteria group bacterium]|nr:hypothetical protein [Patescibacteria group bacterium]